LNGFSLVERAIRVAVDSKLFQLIVVSSDDETILETAYKYFNKGLVQPHKRPERMARDDIALKEVCLHCLRCYSTQATEFCLLIPNNPFRTSGDLIRAYREFRKSKSNYLITVNKYDKPPQLALSIKDGFIHPVGGETNKQSQELEPMYYENGAICFTKIEAFLKEFPMNFYGSSCLPYVLKHPSFEIDTKNDFEEAKCLMEKLSL